MAESESSRVKGEILGRGSDPRQVRVRMQTGEEILAVLPRIRAMRKFGCLFGTLVGWKACVVIPKPPRMPRVVDLSRPENQAVSENVNQPDE